MQKINILYTELYELYINQGKNTYEIAEIYNCSTNCITNKLKKYDIKIRNQYEARNRISDLSVLLEDNNISYYWIGFLLADGCFYNNSIKLCLSIKDEEHLKEYGNFIKSNNIKNHKTYCVIEHKDIKIVPQIQIKFDIKKQKTYYPPNINIKEQNLLFSLLIGFIDGDGNIQNQYKRQDCILTIKNHKSWINFLELYQIFCHHCKIKINNQGYAQLRLSYSKELQYLKNQAKEYNLPILERKWNKII